MNKMQGSQDSMTKHFFDCKLEMIDFFNIPFLAPTEDSKGEHVRGKYKSKYYICIKNMFEKTTGC